MAARNHYSVDRRAAEEVARRRPQVVAGARANRAFLARVVRYLAEDCGIRQFLDIGTGLPGPGNAHEAAQAVAPGSRVVYADNDPLVLVHARAQLTPTPPGTCGYLDADLRDMAALLTQAAQILDFAQPTAVLLLAVLHFISDADDPAGVVGALAAALAPGSYLAISHLTADFAPEPVAAGVAAYNAAVATAVTPRTHTQVSGLLTGLSLVAPGVVPVAEWRPATSLPHRHIGDLYAGLARTPQART